MSVLEQLLEMGYDFDIAEEALRATNEAGLEEAMNYIMHPSERQQNVSAADEKAKSKPEAKSKSEAKPKEDLDNEESSSIVELIEDEEDDDDDEKPHQPPQTKAQAEPKAQASSAPKEQPMSYKCLECGILFLGMEKLNVHVGLTKHTNFEESTEVVKPLTEEEKREKLAQAQLKLAESRVRKEEQAKRDAIEKEMKRRHDGQSIAEIEEQRKQKEIKDWVAQKKREKIEEQQARKRVLEQIKMDREARWNVDHPQAAAKQPAPQPTMVTPPPSTPSTDAKLQIRLPDGTVVRQTFEANETLAAVRVWAHMQCVEKAGISGDIELISPFPRRVFSKSDYAKPLNALGLTPSASLVVQALPTLK